MILAGRQLNILIGQSLIRTSQRALRSKGRQLPIENELQTQPTASISFNDSRTPGSHPTEIDIDWAREMDLIRSQESLSVLEPVANFNVTTSYPLTRPSHNLAAFVKTNKTLQQFIRLGVDLHKIERKNGLAPFVVKLDFERDVQPHLRFLTDLGLSADALGTFITKNPLFFKENLDDLTTRVHYLQSKLFKADDILRIVEKNPFWLMFSTQRIDGRLGFYQKQFELTGPEVRQLTIRQPKLITYGLDAVRKNTFVIREEFGFDQGETKALLLAAPKMWMMSKRFGISFSIPDKLKRIALQTRTP